MGAVPVARLEAALDAAPRCGAGLAVIDTASHSESSALAAARAANLALVPLRPGLFDIAALDATAPPLHSCHPSRSPSCSTTSLRVAERRTSPQPPCRTTAPKSRQPCGQRESTGPS